MPYVGCRYECNGSRFFFCKNDANETWGNYTDGAVINPKEQKPKEKPFFSEYEYTVKSHKFIPKKQSVFYDDVNHLDYEARKKSRANCFEADDLAIIKGGCAATGFLVYVGIASAPVWIPALGNFGKATWQGTKTASKIFHNVYGMQGGYLSVGGNAVSQSFAIDSWRDFNIAGTIFAGFMSPQNSLITNGILGAGASGGLFHVTANDVGSNIYKNPLYGGLTTINGILLGPTLSPVVGTFGESVCTGVYQRLLEETLQKKIQ
jgi:hypothetical protein